MEGIMMRHQNQYSVAVRKPNGEIVTKIEPCKSWSQGKKIWRLPIFRGMYSFVESLVVGMQCLTYSASFFDEEEEPKQENGEKNSKAENFEKQNTEKTEKSIGKENTVKDESKKEKQEKMLMYGTVAISICFSIALFIVLPYFIASIFRTVTESEVIISIAEACARLLIFFTYIVLISKMEDIQRVFMYHGAEHKCISCIESGMELNVENVMKSSKEHKRCGTSFLLFVMFVSVIFFLFIRVSSPWLRVLVRILLMPVIAGVSYELIRLAGNSDHPVVSLLSKPGLALQKLTTKEPEPDMVEVAICAVEAVFDWKAYLAENADDTAKKD